MLIARRHRFSMGASQIGGSSDQTVVMRRVFFCTKFSHTITRKPASTFGFPSQTAPSVLHVQLEAYYAAPRLGQGPQVPAVESDAVAQIASGVMTRSPRCPVLLSLSQKSVRAEYEGMRG